MSANKETIADTWLYEEWRYLKPGGHKGDWKCVLCHYNPVTIKMVYSSPTLGKNFKLVCDDCIEMSCGRSFFSKNCILHNETI